MHGDVIINGVDIYDHYKAYITRGSLPSIFQWPESKDVESNDWTEEDGVEADLSVLRLKGRDIQLTFGFRDASVTNMKAFFSWLMAQMTASGPLTLTFSNLGITLRARLRSTTSLDYMMQLSSVIATFRQDESLLGDGTYTPTTSLPVRNGYLYDGAPLSRFGVIVTDDSVNDTSVRFDVKSLLERDLSTIDGTEYDSNPLDTYDSGEGKWHSSSSLHGTAHFKTSSTISLHCALVADNAQQAWNNSLALLQDLINPNGAATDITSACLHRLDVDETRERIDFFYRSQAVNDVVLFQDGRVWIVFDLILSKTN